MDTRTEHLIALIKDGATLKDAARVYGISGERVRQLLKEGGINSSDLPGRAAKPRSRRSAPPRELAPAIEAMWHEGMRYHEIAEVFDSSCEAVHRLIYERVPHADRSALAARRLGEGRSDDERLLCGMRAAASVLAEEAAINPEYRREVQALLDRWLAEHAQLTAAADVGSPSELTETADPASSSEYLSPTELHRKLDHFKEELRAGGLRESTIHAYLLGSSLFVRWLGGDYVPRGRC